MLEVLGLAKSFGLQAIFKNFGLNLPQGGFTVLVGPSGIYPAVALGDRCLCGDKSPPDLAPCPGHSHRDHPGHCTCPCDIDTSGNIHVCPARH